MHAWQVARFQVDPGACESGAGDSDVVTRNAQLSLKSANQEARRQKVRTNKENSAKGSKANKGKKSRKGKKGKRGKKGMKEVIPDVDSTLSPSKRNIKILRKRNQELADWWVENHPQNKKKPRTMKESVPTGHSEAAAASKVKKTKKNQHQGETDMQPAQAERHASKAKAKAHATSKVCKVSKKKDNKVPVAAADSPRPKAKAAAKAKGRAKASAARPNRGGEAVMDESLRSQEQIDTLIGFATEIGDDWDSVTNATFKAVVRSKVSNLSLSRLNIYWARTTAGVHVFELSKDMHHFSFNSSHACAPYRVAVPTKCAELAATCLCVTLSLLLGVGCTLQHFQDFSFPFCTAPEQLSPRLSHETKLGKPGFDEAHSLSHQNSKTGCVSTVETGGSRCFTFMCRCTAIDFCFWMVFCRIKKSDIV